MYSLIDFTDMFDSQIYTMRIRMVKCWRHILTFRHDNLLPAERSPIMEDNQLHFIGILSL